MARPGQDKDRNLELDLGQQLGEREPSKTSSTDSWAYLQKTGKPGSQINP